MGVPLYVICDFSLVAFNILSLSFNFCQFDYYVSWCVPSSLGLSCWESLCFLNLTDYFLSCVWEVFSYYLFKYFSKSFLSFSFWASSNENVGALNVVPEDS